MRQALGGSNGDLSIFIIRPIPAVIPGLLASLILGTILGALRRHKP